MDPVFSLPRPLVWLVSLLNGFRSQLSPPLDVSVPLTFFFAATVLAAKVSPPVQRGVSIFLEFQPVCVLVLQARESVHLHLQLSQISPCHRLSHRLVDCWPSSTIMRWEQASFSSSFSFSSMAAERQMECHQLLQDLH